MESESHKKIPVIFFCIMFVVFAIGFLPGNLIMVDSLKSLEFTALGGISFFLLIYFLFKGVPFPKNITIAIPLIIIFTAFLSAIINKTFVISWSGIGYEIDTIVFIISFFSVFIFGSLFFRTIKGVQVLFGLLFSLFVVVSFLETIDIFFYQFTNDPAFTIVGSWFNLGIFYGLYIILFSLFLEFYRPNGVRLALLFVSLIFSIVMLFIVGFSFVWKIIAVYSLIAITIKSHFFFLSKKSGIVDGPGNSRRVVPIYAIALFILSIALFYFTDNYSEFSNTRNIKEIRPSISSTISVLSGLSQKNITSALLGSGPKSFSDSWNLYKPLDYNRSPFWNNDFEFGVSLFATIMVTTGLLGAISWLLLILYVHYDFWRAIKSKIDDHSNMAIVLILSVVASYGWAVFIFYTPGVVFLSIIALITGALVGLSKEDTLIISLKSSWRSIALPVFIFFTIGIVLLCFLGISKKFFSIIHYQKGLKAFNSGNFSESQREMKTAIVFNETYILNRLLSQSYQAEIVDFLNKNNLSDSTQKQFEILSNAAVGYAQSAINLNPRNYLNFVVLGNAYTTLATTRVSGLREFGEYAYRNSITLNPSSPLPHFLFGRFLAFVGDQKGALGELNIAISLKPDYKEAIDLIEELKKYSVKKIEQEITPIEQIDSHQRTTTPQLPQLF